MDKKKPKGMSDKKWNEIKDKPKNYVINIEPAHIGVTMSPGQKAVRGRRVPGVKPRKVA